MPTEHIEDPATDLEARRAELLPIVVQQISEQDDRRRRQTTLRMAQWVVTQALGTLLGAALLYVGAVALGLLRGAALFEVIVIAVLALGPALSILLLVRESPVSKEDAELQDIGAALLLRDIGLKLSNGEELTPDERLALPHLVAQQKRHQNGS